MVDRDKLGSPIVLSPIVAAPCSEQPYYLRLTIYYSLQPRHNRPRNSPPTLNLHVGEIAPNNLKDYLRKLGVTMTEPDKKDVGIASAEDNSQAGTSPRRKPEGNDTGERMRAVVADYEARLNEVAEVIARVRHEINNPLTGVLGQAQLLLREDLSERARKRAEIIEELAIRIRDIVALLRQVQKPLRSSGNNESSSV